MLRRILFTALPTNDLGLLTRLLPIAHGLRNGDNEILFSHPAPAAKKILQQNQFANYPPMHPLYKVASGEFKFSELFRKDALMPFGGRWPFLRELVRCFPYKKATPTTEVWDQDHAFAITGFMNFHFCMANVIAYIELMKRQNVDVVVDAWNPMACIAARHLKKKLVTVNQGDALPWAKGFIWWRPKTGSTPSVVPVFNRVLDHFQLPRIKRIEELNVGGLTLVTGSPATDPLTDNSVCQYVGSLLDESSHIQSVAFEEKLKKDEVPIVWLYAGNLRYGGSSAIFDSYSMVEASIEALAQLPVQVIFTKGHHT